MYTLSISQEQNITVKHHLENQKTSDYQQYEYKI